MYLEYAKAYAPLVKPSNCLKYVTHTYSLDLVDLTQCAGVTYFTQLGSFVGGTYRAGHHHPYKVYVWARNTAPVHRTGRGIVVARPYPMYGLWMTIHKHIVDG